MEVVIILELDDSSGTRQITRWQEWYVSRNSKTAVVLIKKLKGSSGTHQGTRWQQWWICQGTQRQQWYSSKNSKVAEVLLKKLTGTSISCQGTDAPVIPGQGTWQHQWYPSRNSVVLTFMAKLRNEKRSIWSTSEIFKFYIGSTGIRLKRNEEVKPSTWICKFAYPFAFCEKFRKMTTWAAVPPRKSLLFFKDNEEAPLNLCRTLNIEKEQ